MGMQDIQEVLDNLEASGKDYITVGSPDGSTPVMVAVKPEAFRSLHAGYPLTADGKTRKGPLWDLDRSIEAVRETARYMDSENLAWVD